MTDIPSGAEDSALSGGDTDDGSGGDVDYSGRPSSAPPTLFGMSMKKVLSRPTDRVEQVIVIVVVIVVGMSVIGVLGCISTTVVV